MKKKKTIKFIIIAVLVVAVAAGSITGVVYYKNSKGLASVMSVSTISTTNDYTSMTSEGIVCDDVGQTINLSDGQKVTEVYVTKDQQVKAGDKLLAYDVTSLSLSVELKQLEIKSLENQLASEKQKLDKLKNTKPVAKQPETPVTPEPQPEQKPDEQHDVISDLSEAKGSGTEDNPYVFTCTEASYVSGSLLNTLADKSAVARFVIGDANAPDMELIVRGDKLGSYDDSDEIKIFLAGTITAGDASDDTAGNVPSYTAADTATEHATQTEADTAAEEKTYTADELKDAIKEQTRSVADVDLKKRIAQADLKELQNELEDGVVYAKKDGIVTTVCDPANPPKDGTPFLQLSGASGLYISGTIGELDLDKVKVGQSVSAVNYMTGDTYEGTISEISNVPSDSVNYGDSNPNSSFYGYTAYIENPQNLKKGDSLQLTIDTSSEGSDSGLYIDKSYVRTEKGQSYIYKDDNGKLKKQSVKTGKSLWGSYVEIKSGLTNDDYIAFPYGVREGEKTKVSEDGMY